MSKALRIGILGMTHDHVWDVLRHAHEVADMQIVAAADPSEELRTAATNAGIKKVFADYLELLNKTELDAVLVMGDNMTGVDAAIAAAKRGLHIMTEKPMASTYAGALAMYQAAKSAGVVMMVNWPFAWRADVQHAIALTKRGKVGNVFSVNYRAAHCGPRELGCSPHFVGWLYDPTLNGAGAFMDYCCYGAALDCMLVGMPSRVTAVAGRLRKTDLPAEDNAVMIMQHQNAISTSTASWTQIGHMTSYEPIIYGDKGTLKASQGKLYFSDAENDLGVQVRVPKIAPGYRHALEHFVAVIRQEVPLLELCSGEVALMAQEVLEAGLISANTNMTVSLPLPPHAMVRGG
ncbi:MAG: Gfo/Idh/MocA family protein [Chloroflexota bacterium]|jgi:predicted dehydrogenase